MEAVLGFSKYFPVLGLPSQLLVLDQYWLVVLVIHGPTTSNYAGAAGSNDIYNRRTFEHQKDDLMKRGKTFARKMSAPVLRLFHCNRKKAAETLL